MRYKKPNKEELNEQLIEAANACAAQIVLM